MKNSLFKFSCIVFSMLVSCTNQQGIPPALLWEMGANGIKGGFYESSFFIVNQDTKPLKSNWVIYFNQLMFGTVQQEENAPVKVEQISAGFYKMYPSLAYQPILPGDTLPVSFLTPGGLIKKCMAPEGAYFVRINSKGKESKPETLAMQYLPFTKEEQWSRPRTAELPYPSGEIVYDETLPFVRTVSLQAADIFPSPKMVTYNEERSLVFGKKFELKYPSQFANEANILRDILKKQLNFTETGDFSKIIKLAPLRPGMIPQNEEHYLLEIGISDITIEGATPHAIFNGIQTLLSLLNSIKFPYVLPNMLISDYPDLMYRGQMIDVARNFTTKDNILRIIDLLSMYKMNRLHFHLVDDEGWRLEIPGLEELTDIGSKRGHTPDESKCLHPAYGSGWNPDDTASCGNGYYSRTDFIEILQYASNRHIKVIPEIDIPGHSRAAIKSMNARYQKYIKTDPAKANEYLLTDFADTSRYVSAQGYNDNTLNAALPSVYRFIEKVVNELVSVYHDAGLKLDVLHLGGDEIPRGAWEGSPLCHAFMLKENIADIQGLKDYFWRQALTVLKKREIQPAGWQEISLRDDDTVNPLFVNENVLSYCWNTIPEWQGDQIPYQLANGGYPVILSNVTNFYLDFAYNKHPYEPGHYWGGFLNEVNSFNMLPFRIYLSSRKDLSGHPVDIYTAEKQKLALKPEARQQIKGVNGQLWAENIRNYDMIEYLLFPKIFGLIERGWNAQPDWSLTDREEDYLRALRLYRSKISERELPRLAKLGVNFRIMQPGLKIIDGKLHANCVLPNATIYYTTDNSEPNTESPVWTKPVDCSAKMVKAKAFYKGKESVTTGLEMN